MHEYKTMTVVEDSKENKYIFLYKNNSIYCSEIAKDNKTKEALVVSQVNTDFKVVLCNNDTIYIVCNSKEKGLLIYSYENNKWKFNQILSMQNYSNIVLVSAYALNKSIHIIYAKKMPVSNLYNVYHIYSSDKGVINSSWKKNNITELYVYSNNKNNNISKCISTTIDADNSIHLVNLWHDGINYSITYCFYDSIKEIWNKKNIDIQFSKEISIQLLSDNNKLHLLFLFAEGESYNVYYYIKSSSDNNFNFVSLSKLNVDSNCIFHSDNSLYCASLYNSNFNEFMYLDNKNDWEAIREYDIDSIKNIYKVDYSKNDDLQIINYQTFMILDENYNLLMPWKQKYKEYKASIKEKSKLYSHGEGKFVDPINTHIPFILEEIRRLSGCIEELSNKINEIHNTNKDTFSKSNSATVVPSVSKGNDDSQRTHTKNKSNFKEKFMSNNTFINKPPTTMIYVGDGSIPKPSNNKFEAKSKTTHQLIENPLEANNPELSSEALEDSNLESTVMPENKTDPIKNVSS